MTECEIMRIEKASLIRVLHDESDFSELFLSHLVTRTTRVEADLVDQLFNSSEKRLARALLYIGEFRQRGPPGAGHRQCQPGNPCQDDQHARARVNHFM